jgi:ketosteroid isomerase-like protein
MEIIMAAIDRKFLERLFSYHTQGNMDKFFEYFDPNMKWTIHGESVLAKTYNSVEELKDALQKYLDSISGSPKRKLRYFIVEGNKAAAFLTDEVKGKDGKTYQLEYSLTLEFSNDGKVIRVDNFMDSMTMHNILTSSEKKRAA